MSPLFNDALKATIEQLKQKFNYEQYLTKLAHQHQWIRTKCPTIDNDADIERIRIALESIKPCKNCLRKTCPKTTSRYTYVGEISWFNDRTYLRWVTDCRDVKTPLPTINTFRDNLELEQAAINEARETANKWAT